MKKQNKRRFSSVEDKLIVDTVKKNIHNLQFAFRRVSELLKDRSVESISQRYYGVIRKNTPIFAHVSRGGIIMNTKNVEIDENGSVDKLSRITTENALALFNLLTKGQQNQFRNAIN